jgi:carbamoyl-phosphate synthase large subunit
VVGVTGVELPRQVVLVTGAGGPAGVSVILALRKLGHASVGADASAEAVGARLADFGAVLPFADDPGYADALCQVAERYGVTALIPTVAEELVALHGHVDRLSAVGVAHWLPDPDGVESCTDKWRFHLAATAAGVAVPVTALGTTEGVPGPWVVKPRHGRGSRDIYVTDDAAEVARLVPRVPDPMVQHCLAGREFTVDALVDKAGVLVAAVPRWRNETKAGISTQGETFARDGLDAEVAGLLTAVGHTGPANVQGFVGPASGDRDSVVFTEINPRFSGGLPLSLAAGADLVGQYLRGMHGLTLEPERLGFVPGVRMYRYFEELFESPAG